MSITNGYIQLPDIKNWMGLSPDDGAEDTELERAANAACRAIDQYCLRHFYLDAVPSPRTYAAIDRHIVFTRDIGSADSLAVMTDWDGDGIFETTMDPSVVQLEPTNALLDNRPITSVRCLSHVENQRFPIYHSQRAAVQITAQWGWPAVPDEIVEASLILAHRIFKRKGTPSGIAGFSDETAMVYRITRTDPDVVALIQPYRKLRP